MLYHFAWVAGLLFALPAAVISKNRRFLQRLAPPLPARPLKGGSIWIHSLSVGEVISSLSLVKRVRVRYPHKEIVFTATTSQGLAIARKELEGVVDYVLPLPLDFWWAMRRFVQAVKPGIFVLVETDLWPGLLHLLKKRGVRALLVNGRVSPKTFRSYRRCPFLVRRMFEGLDFCLMQSDLDRGRLLEVGLDPERVLTVGNIKFDHEHRPMAEGERERWLHDLGLGREDWIWVAGSTHRGEEEVLLRVFKRIQGSYPTLRLIIAPRRIEESEEISRMARAMGLRPRLRTEGSKAKGSFDILVLDTLGELERVYGLAAFSFVGGSLVPCGGHNLLEPASFGHPVLFGPHTDNFVLMSEMLEERGGGLRVGGEEELHSAVKTLLKDPGLRHRMGRCAQRFVKGNQGALDRVIGEISDLLPRGTEELA